MSSQQLKQVGLKVTLPRIHILSILSQDGASHLSAEDIHKKLQITGHEVGLATVYRVLTQFVEAGLVIRHNFETDHCVFELDGGEHHDHMVCSKCSRVIEFVDPIIEERQTEIAAKNDFKITDHTLCMHGLCVDCS